MNFVILHGKVTWGPEEKQYQDRKPFVVFGFGVRQEQKNAEGKYGTDFYNCIYSGTSQKYLRGKGQELILQGRIENNFWKDKNGIEHKDSQIVVRTIDFCGPPPEPKPIPPQDPDTYQPAPELFEEDLPF